MPRIPIFTAEAASPRPRTPSYIPGGDYSAQQGVAQQIGRSGDAFTEAGLNILGQNEENELINMDARYTSGIKAIHQGISLDPDVKENPGLYSQKFNEGIKTLVNELNKSASSDRVRTKFNNYVDKTLPEHQIEAEGIGLKLSAIHGRAEHDLIIDKMAEVAANAPKNTSAAIIDMAKSAINNAWKRNFYKDEVAKDKAIKDFETKVLEKRMVIMGEYELKMSGDLYALRVAFKDGEFDGVPEFQRLSIMEKLEKGEEQAKTRAKVAFNDGKAITYNNYESLAATKDLSQADIDEMKRGGMLKYGITAGDGLHFEKIQNAVDTTEGSDAATRIMEAWSTSRRTNADTEYARTQLDNLQKDLVAAGKSNKNIVTYGNMLNSQFITNRSLAAQEKVADINRAIEALTINRPPPSIIPFQARRDVDEAKKENARVKLLRDQGMNWEEIVRTITKEREEKRGIDVKRNPAGSRPTDAGSPRTNTQADVDEALERR